MIDQTKLIGGRYRISEHLGRGGMQEVFLGVDTVLDMPVAIKTPQAPNKASRFRKSALVAARVNHHNVAKTFDYLEQEGAEYLVEEFVSGENLEEKQQMFGILDPHMGAQVLHNLAKGIAASHRAGVVHRDLKPSNVMVSKGSNIQQLKITDFGVATLTKEIFDDAANAGDITQSNSGTVRGALPFMAPEMMFRTKGEIPDAPVDIWSLGAMMFKLLTGEFPFGVYLDAAVNVKNRTRLPWPEFMTNNQQFAPLARDLQKIVDSCLDYDYVARPDALTVVAACSDLCYLAVDRYEGTVTNLIQNGYSGFIDFAEGTAFFSMESVYGSHRPKKNSRVSFASFPGSPQWRAHPIVPLK
jgi:serine/threonine-protein kinase